MTADGETRHDNVTTARARAAELGMRLEKLTMLGELVAQERLQTLHGGHLCVGDPHDDSTAVVMELPTGAPHAATPGVQVEQAQRYALDMAALPVRQQAAAKTIAR